jgi:hypothetical protein
MPIPAASGYPQYSNSLTTPIFRADLLDRFYDTTIYSDISTTEYTGDLSRGGDQITFMREPKVVVRDYNKNDKIIHDTIDGEPVTMTIDYAKTFSIKMNHIDEKQIQNFDKWKAAFLKSAGYELTRQIDPQLLTAMWTGAAAFNQGATAGAVSANINLGAPGAPLVLTKLNINEVLTQIHQVLDEALAPQEGRFIVLPPAGITALLNSELRLAYATGMDKSPLLNGRLPDEIGGFMILRSINMPSVLDGGTGKRAFHIVAGVKMATAFAAQIEDSRVVTDKDDWANYYQGLSVYGFKVLYGDALVHVYATFDAS